MWRDHGVSISYFDQCKELTGVRAEGILPDGMSSQAQRYALDRLDKAFSTFFQRCKSGQKPGFPRFKSRRRYDSLTWPCGNGASLRDKQLKVMGIESIRVNLHRDIPPNADVRTVTIKKQNERWYAIFAIRISDLIPRSSTDQSIGVDCGVTVPFVLSTGEHIEGPRAQKINVSNLRRASRKVSRRKKGSNRRRKAIMLLAIQKEQEANRRKDFLHKFSRRLVNENDTIVFEDLSVKNMTRSASGTIDNPGTKVAQKRGLNREILDQGWSMLVQMTIYKAEEAGRSVIKVPTPYTSQTCHECEVIDKKSRAREVFRCTACGYQDHADTNAAKNILRAGLALQALTQDEEVCVV